MGPETLPSWAPFSWSVSHSLCIARSPPSIRWKKRAGASMWWSQRSMGGVGVVVVVGLLGPASLPVTLNQLHHRRCFMVAPHCFTILDYLICHCIIYLPTFYHLFLLLIHTMHEHMDAYFCKFQHTYSSSSKPLLYWKHIATIGTNCYVGCLNLKMSSTMACSLTSMMLTLTK